MICREVAPYCLIHGFSRGWNTVGNPRAQMPEWMHRSGFQTIVTCPFGYSLVMIQEFKVDYKYSENTFMKKAFLAKGFLSCLVKLVVQLLFPFFHRYVLRNEIIVVARLAVIVWPTVYFRNVSMPVSVDVFDRRRPLERG